AVHPPTFTLTRSGNSALITIDEKYKPTCGSDHPNKLYSSLEDSHGRIYKYYVYDLINGNQITIPETLLKVGVKVNVFYKGYYASLQF
ncbi:MAG TPA: hypothetical protein VFJ43_17540, partial [Bacteroidia bacterium]|nr:hypothetical protein [Bacteroidia bacterium]